MVHRRFEVTETTLPLPTDLSGVKVICVLKAWICCEFFAASALKEKQLWPEKTLLLQEHNDHIDSVIFLWRCMPQCKTLIILQYFYSLNCFSVYLELLVYWSWQLLALLYDMMLTINNLSVIWYAAIHYNQQYGGKDLLLYHIAWIDCFCSYTTMPVGESCKVNRYSDWASSEIWRGDHVSSLDNWELMLSMRAQAQTVHAEGEGKQFVIIHPRGWPHDYHTCDLESHTPKLSIKGTAGYCAALELKEGMLNTFALWN